MARQLTANQQRAIEGGVNAIRVRVEVQDAGGNWRRLDALEEPGGEFYNRAVRAEIEHLPDERISKLRLFAAEGSNLESIFTRKGASHHNLPNTLLDINNRIRVWCALLGPNGEEPTEADYSLRFDGLLGYEIESDGTEVPVAAQDDSKRLMVDYIDPDVFVGKVTSGTATTITDAGRTGDLAWRSGMFAPNSTFGDATTATWRLEVTDQDGHVQTRPIASNTGDTITVAEAFDATLDGTYTYKVLAPIGGMQNVIQALLVASFGSEAPLLEVEHDPDWDIPHWGGDETLGDLRCLQLLHNIADQKPMDIRYKFHEPSGEYRLTLWSPWASGGAPSWHVDEWADILEERLVVDDRDLRNWIKVSYWRLWASGTATAGGANSLETGESMTENEHAGRVLILTGGTGEGQAARIKSNTSDGILVVDSAWETKPDATTEWEIKALDHVVSKDQDAGRLQKYFRRPMEVRLSATDKINDPDDAQGLADTIRDELQDLTITAQPLRMRWHPGIEIFDVVSVRNPMIRDGRDLLTVRRITEVLDPDDPHLSIEGTGSFTIYIQRWIAKETIKGVSAPTQANDTRIISMDRQTGLLRLSSPSTVGSVGANRFDVVAPAKPTLDVGNATTTIEQSPGGGQMATLTVPFTHGGETDIAGFLFQVRVKGEAEVRTIEEGRDATAVTFGGLIPNKTYEVRGGTFDRTENFSDWSAWAEVATGKDETPPDKPAAPTVVSTLRGLAVRITTPNTEVDLAGYRVYISETSGFSPGPTTLAGTILARPGELVQGNYLDLDPAKTYYVKLIAIDTSENPSVPSDEVSESPDYIDVGDLDPTPPDDVTGLVVDFTGPDAVATWEPAARATSYRVQILDTSDNVMRVEEIVGTTYRYTHAQNVEDFGAPGWPSIKVSVEGLNEAGNYSENATVEPATNAPPAQPLVEGDSSLTQVRWALKSPNPPDFKSLTVEVGTYSLTTTATSGTVDLRDAGLGDGDDDNVVVTITDVFDQDSTPGTVQITGRYLTEEDMQGALFALVPTASPAPDSGDLESLWDMDVETGCVWGPNSEPVTVTFRYPVEQGSDMIRLYIDAGEGNTVEGYVQMKRADNGAWIDVAGSELDPIEFGHGWNVVRFAQNRLYFGKEYRIVFTDTSDAEPDGETAGSLALMELKFWRVSLADEILAERLRLTGDMWIESQDGRAIVGPLQSGGFGFSAEDAEGNRSELTEGRLAFYRSGEDAPFYYLRHVEMDIADIDVPVTFSAPFDAPPRVMLAVQQLKSYDSSVGGTQVWSAFPESVTTTGFVPRARLEVQGGSKSETTKYGKQETGYFSKKVIISSADAGYPQRYTDLTPTTAMSWRVELGSFIDAMVMTIWIEYREEGAANWIEAHSAFLQGTSHTGPQVTNAFVGGLNGNKYEWRILGECISFFNSPGPATLSILNWSWNGNTVISSQGKVQWIAVERE